MIEIVHKDGMKKIESTFKRLLKNCDLDQWAEEFTYNVANFRLNLADFEKKSLNKLFSHILTTKCDNCLSELYDVYDYVVTVRSFHLQILIIYYTNKQSFSVVDKQVN